MSKIPSAEDLRNALAKAREHADTNMETELNKAKALIYEHVIEHQKKGDRKFTLATRLVPLSSQESVQALRMWSQAAGVTICLVDDQRDGNYWDISWR